MELLSEVVGEAARKKAAEAGIVDAPEWLGGVPKDKQDAAFCRWVDDRVASAKRAVAVIGARKARKEARAKVNSDIRSEGYEITYLYFAHYNVAIAFYAQPPDIQTGQVELRCYFAICSPEDEAKFSRVKSRELLLKRIRDNDQAHMFCCFIPNRKRRVDVLVRRRFLEHVEDHSQGLPHDFVQIIRVPFRGSGR